MISIDQILVYLSAHAFVTVGAVITFLLRTEHRMTKLETQLSLLQRQHDRLTNDGTALHIFGDPER